MENEVDWFPEITKSKKKIVVVGGGIAGLEAAWVASARGNEVTLFSSSSELGGKIKLNASLPGCDALSSIYDYQKVMLQKTKVNVKYNWYAEVDDIVGCKPDAVILATGGSMMWPKFFKKEWFEEGIIFDLRNTILNTHNNYVCGQGEAWHACHGQMGSQALCKPISFGTLERS